MGKKRFYDAVRDLIRDVHDTPAEPARTRRRLSIASLLAAPPTCAACWDPVPPDSPLFACNNCLGTYCPSCLTQYAKTALSDRNLLPLRCADEKCRSPVPLSGLSGLLSGEEIDTLSRFQCEKLKKEEVDENGGDEQVREVMNEMGWKCCPDCGMGIERTQGCPHMVCVCGGEFCYSCGERWLGRGQGCPRRCGLPMGQEQIRMLFPARVDELREELWGRIRALLASLRDHFERDRVMLEERFERVGGGAQWEPDRISVRGLTGGVVDLVGVNRVVTRSVSRNSTREQAGLVKMSVENLVHGNFVEPTWQKRM